jgi:hypothetical protein
MLRLPSHCNFIDLNAHHGAMNILLNTPQMTPINGFQHLYLAVGSVRLLMDYYSPEYQTSNTLQHKASKEHFIYCDPYRAIRGGTTAGMLNLVIPGDTYTGLPSRRTISAYQIWDHEPSTDDITCIAIRGNRFCVNTLCLKIDFNDYTLDLKKIPLRDWLLKPENKGSYQAMRSAGAYQHNGDRVTATLGAFTLDLGKCEGGVFGEGVGRMVNLVDEICKRLGLPGGEVRRIAGVMLEVWGEEKMGSGET